MLQDMKQCFICPRECKVDRTKKEKGSCQASDTMTIARYSLHLWEEPCLSGDHGSGTIFFSYCNLKCIFCQNYKISEEHIGYEITIDEFVDICLELQKKGAHNINLVTPTHYVPQIILGIEKAKEKGLHLPVIYNSSGYEKRETIKKLNKTIDIYMPDFKYFDDSLSLRYSHVPNYSKYIKESLDEMFHQVGFLSYDEKGLLKKGVIVRHLCLPGEGKDSKNVLKYLYQTYQNKILISIMNQYTPVRNIKKYPNLNRTLTDLEYEEILDYACQIGITNAFIQEGDTKKESFIPEFYNQSKKELVVLFFFLFLFF